MFLVYDKYLDELVPPEEGIYDEDCYEVLKIPNCFLDEGSIFKKSTLRVIDWLAEEFDIEYVRYCGSCYELDFDGLLECSWCGERGLHTFNFKNALKSIASGSTDGKLYWLVGQVFASGIVYLGDDIRSYAEVSGMLFNEAVERGFSDGLLQQVKHIWDASEDMIECNEDIVNLLNQCISLLESLPQVDGDSNKLIEEYKELKQKYESDLAREE